MTSQMNKSKCTSRELRRLGLKGPAPLYHPGSPSFPGPWTPDQHTTSIPSFPQLECSFLTAPKSMISPLGRSIPALLVLAPLPSPTIKLGAVLRQPLVALPGLTLAFWVRMMLNFGSSCVHKPSSGITDMYHYAQSCIAEEPVWGFTDVRQPCYQRSYITNPRRLPLLLFYTT